MVYKSTGLCVHAVYTREGTEARSRALVGCTTHPRRPAAPQRPATPQLKYTRLLKRAQAGFGSSSTLGEALQRVACRITAQRAAGRRRIRASRGTKHRYAPLTTPAEGPHLTAGEMRDQREVGEQRNTCWSATALRDARHGPHAWQRRARRHH